MPATGIKEPKCTQFEYDKLLLEKLIRLEVNFEVISSRVKSMEEAVKDGMASLSHDQRELRKERVTTKRTLLETLDQKAADLDEHVGRLEVNTEERVRKLEDVITKRISGLGAIYTRWGRTECPNDTTMIYQGYAAGSHNTHAGGPVETLCLPKDPQWAKHYPGQQSCYIYGAEYQAANPQFQAIFGNAFHDQDVPCAVCKTSGRPTIMIVPARKECYSGWHLEYNGYLMTSHHTERRVMTKCVDMKPETIQGQNGNSNGDLFYFLEAAGQLPDPPYVRGRELTCAVCSR